MRGIGRRGSLVHWEGITEALRGITEPLRKRRAAWGWVVRWMVRHAARISVSWSAEAGKQGPRWAHYRCVRCDGRGLFGKGGCFSYGKRTLGLEMVLLEAHKFMEKQAFSHIFRPWIPFSTVFTRRERLKCGFPGWNRLKIAIFYDELSLC